MYFNASSLHRERTARIVRGQVVTRFISSSQRTNNNVFGARTSDIITTVAAAVHGVLSPFFRARTHRPRAFPRVSTPPHGTDHHGHAAPKRCAADRVGSVPATPPAPRARPSGGRENIVTFTRSNDIRSLWFYFYFFLRKSRETNTFEARTRPHRYAIVLYCVPITAYESLFHFFFFSSTA